MIEHWNKTERFEGTIYHGEEELGECKFVFYWNPFKTKNMRVEIFECSTNLNKIDRFTNSPFLIKCNYGDRLKYQFDLNFELNNFSIKAREYVTYVPVNQYKAIKTFSDDTPKILHSSVAFPLTKSTDNILESTHSSYGMFYGKLEENTVQFDKKALYLNSEIGELYLEDNFSFIDSKKTDQHVKFFPCKLSLKQSKLFWSKNLKSRKDLDNSKNSFQNKSKEILLLLSIIERDRIDWHHIKNVSHGDLEGKNIIEMEDIYKYAVFPSEHLGRNNFTQNQLHDTIQLVLKRYENLIKRRRNEINKLAENFQIAALTKTFEDSFIRWHSCLDFLRDKYGKGGRNISKQLLAVFKENSIPISDLINEEILTKISSGDIQFPFTELRNKYIHDGFDAFSPDYQYGLDQRRIMRALAERLLLNLLKIDFRETHLGKKEV